MPASPLFIAKAEGKDTLDALRKVPRVTQPEKSLIEKEMEACWPVELGEEMAAHKIVVYDRRDWKNQIHTGRRLRIEGLIREEV